MAIYFVDYVGGADTNNGTAQGTAWKHCPGDPAATNTASGTSLSPADTVNFKGGVSYVFTGATGIVLGFSGSSGNIITYQGNASVHGWGSGRAILTDNYGANAIAAFSASVGRSFITISGFEFANIGGSAVLPTDTGSAVPSRNGYAFTCTASCGPSFTITDFYAHNLGYYFNAKPMDQNSVDGAGFFFGSGAMPKGVTISNGSIARTNVGISAGGDAASGMSLTIDTVQFTDSIRWCIDIHGNALNAQITNVTINNCDLYDYYQLTAGNWTGYGDAPHVDGIFMRSFNIADSANATWSNIIVNGNRFYATPAAVNNSSTATVYITEGPSATFTNNIFGYSLGSRTIYLINTTNPDKAQTVNLYNNSFLINNTPGWSIDNNATSNAYGNLTMNVENNLFYDVCTGIGSNFCFYLNANDPLVNVFVNYNIYQSFNFVTGQGGTLGHEFFAWFSTGGIGEGGITLARSHGWENNGDQNNPLFVTVNTTDYTLSNLHLQVGSPARSTGTNLTSLGIALLNKDALGANRPSSGPWDMGAFQDSGGGSSTTLVYKRLGRYLKFSGLSS